MAVVASFSSTQVKEYISSAALQILQKITQGLF
jgi:hypothetical protein